MGNVVRYGLGQEVASYSHADNAFELNLGHASSPSEVGIGNGAVERNVGEDTEVTKPTDACKHLVLELISATACGYGRLNMSDLSKIAAGYEIDDRMRILKRETLLFPHTD